MTRVLFEWVRTTTGRHWHTDIYRCVIVKNWFYLLRLWGCRTFITRLDEAGQFVIYEKFKRPHYKNKMINYTLGGENIIQWLKDSIIGSCSVVVKVDKCGDEFSIHGSGLIVDQQDMMVTFTSEIDASAFKLRFLS